MYARLVCLFDLLYIHPRGHQPSTKGISSVMTNLTFESRDNRRLTIFSRRQRDRKKDHEIIRAASPLLVSFSTFTSPAFAIRDFSSESEVYRTQVYSVAINLIFNEWYYELI